MNMIKRFFAPLLALSLCLALLLPFCAATERTEVRSEGGQELTEDQQSLPDWYPESWSKFEYFYDSDAPQLTDTADIFTEEEESVIREKLRELREVYGSDFVVFTDVSTYGLSREIYAADFFEATGHGIGQDYSGMILFICMEPGNRGWWTAAKGAVRPLFTEKAINWIDDKLEPYMRSGDYGQGVIQYLDNLDTLYRNGAPPVPFTTFLTALGGSLAVGGIVGFIGMALLEDTMKTVKEAAHADSYLVKGSFRLRHSRNIFLYSTVSRTRRKSSSGGGSSGGSSYSGSYSSSSGSSWSGGGRSF
jgi:uncharacterized protein